MMTAPGDFVAEAGTHPPEPRRRRIMLITAVAVLALALTAFVAYRMGSGDPPQALPTPTPQPTATAEPTTAEIYAALAPSVVTIQALTADSSQVIGSGTGVIANADGRRS